MKRISIIAAMAAIAFSSCQEVILVERTEASFVIDEPITRVTTEGQASKFVEGDVVSITSSGLRTDIAAAYTVTATKTLTAVEETSAVYQFDGSEATFTAHYPASLVNQSGVIAMTVPADQSTDKLFHSNMFMVATGKGSVKNPEVSFKFKHQLSWVRIVVKEEALVVSNITLDNVSPKVTYSSAGLTLDEQASKISIKPWNKAGKEYWALVPAQTFAGGTKLVTINAADGNTYEYTLGANPLALNTAKVTTLTLKGQQISAEFEGIDPDAWGDENTNLGDGELVAKPYEPLVILSGSETLSLPTEPADAYENGQDGWNYVLEAGEGNSINVVDNSFVIVAGAGSWYKNGVFYKLSSEQISAILAAKSKKFKVNFTYNTDNQIRIQVYNAAKEKYAEKYLQSSGNGDYGLIVDLTGKTVSTMSIFWGGNGASYSISNISVQEVVE